MSKRLLNEREKFVARIKSRLMVVDRAVRKDENAVVACDDEEQARLELHRAKTDVANLVMQLYDRLPEDNRKFKNMTGYRYTNKRQLTSLDWGKIQAYLDDFLYAVCKTMWSKKMSLVDVLALDINCNDASPITVARQFSAALKDTEYDYLRIHDLKERKALHNAY